MTNEEDITLFDSHEKKRIQQRSIDLYRKLNKLKDLCTIAENNNEFDRATELTNAIFEIEDEINRLPRNIF